MKILISGEEIQGNSREEKMAKLFDKLNLKDMRYYFMYTLPKEEYNAGLTEYYQFRAWEGPFASIDGKHVDTGETRVVFEIQHNKRGELCRFIEPIIKGRARWTDEYNSCDLWLAFHRFLSPPNLG